MNLPNKLTVIRMILTPFFLITLLIDFPYHYAVSLLIFVVASITDYLDGNIARKQGIVTSFGKFLDPIADKMLTTAAFLGFMVLEIGHGVVWITFIVLLREFIVASVRMVAVSSGGKVIAANIWGKLKTVAQMVAIIFAITAKEAVELFVAFKVPATVMEKIVPILNISTDILLWISAILCVISGVIYLIDNKEFIDTTK